ncbi:hypothetical protein LSH36_78g04013 [Paralvinella palmiformis]|uniref:Neurotransmitter-gated ion-channel transmembrane domain-containing protein n=1 Tax=Paralvinella palmiformis TaxID=53620 RepID=A0AAD9K3S1_9ANNE|nr:hypothetical protein LSH36_78g04013 [Paralvinella palmiformis]
MFIIVTFIIIIIIIINNNNILFMVVLYGRAEFYFKCCPNEKFANVQFSIFLRRRYTFYVMNVILPSLMTSVLLLSIFFCTPGQKVQIGVVVLLSFRIFLLNVTDIHISCMSCPAVEALLQCPLQRIYLTCTMAITTLSMVLTVFVLNLHHVTDRPVPRWAKKLVLVYLARLMCMCQFESKIIREEEEIQERKNKYRVTPNSLGKAIGSQIGLLASLNGTLGVKSSPAGRPRDRKQSTDGGFLDKHEVNYRSRYTYGQEENSDRIDPKRLEEEWTREWRHLAEVVDRLFFWLFLSAIVITTLLLFHPLTKAYFSLLGDETILGNKDNPKPDIASDEQPGSG